MLCWIADPSTRAFCSPVFFRPTLICDRVQSGFIWAIDRCLKNAITFVADEGVNKIPLGPALGLVARSVPLYFKAIS